MKTELTKEMFLGIMYALKKQIDHDEKCNEAFQTILPSSEVTGYDTYRVVEGTLILLSDLMGDKDEWISYFVWELDFGKTFSMGDVVDHGKEIDLSNVGKLWEYLTKER